MAIQILIIINYIVLIFLILISAGYIILLLSSVPQVFCRYHEISWGDELSIMKTYSIIPITAIVPCFNEGSNIFNTIESILNNTYPNKHIIVVNDGSTDNTLEILIEKYQLQAKTFDLSSVFKINAKFKQYYQSKKYPNLVVLDKEHSDKSDSLNVALNACKTPFFLTIDGDTVLESDALSEIVFYTMTKPYLAAAGGAVYVLNGCRVQNGQILERKLPAKLIPALQAIEYLRSFLFARAGLNLFDGSLCLSGAFTLFNYEAVAAINGFDVNNPANDFEIITHLQANRLDKKIPYAIGYTSAPTAWTDVPATFKEYWHQRFIWQIGTLRSLFMYKRMLFNPYYGWTGIFVYPFFLFGEGLGCLVEFAAYLSIFFAWYLGVLNTIAAILFIIICWLFVCILSIASMFLSVMTYNKYSRLRDMPLVLLLVTIESFGFRQYHMICKVIASFYYFIKGGKI